jgi:hypothetical protein
MARIVEAFGTSHRNMLLSAVENWQALFVHVDCKAPTTISRRCDDRCASAGFARKIKYAWRVAALVRTFAHAPGGGGRNMTSCLAESATTSGGFCSFIEWIAQNRS